MTWSALVLAPVLALAAATPAAALYKCVAADGSVVFQQTACHAADGVELEAGDAFGVRPVTAPPPETDSTPEHEPPATDDVHGRPIGQTATGKPIYAGPRGGRYTISASGRKNYLPALSADAATTAPAVPRQPRTEREIHVGARGGCYTLGSTGRKNYLPRAQCPPK